VVEPRSDRGVLSVSVQRLQQHIYAQLFAASTIFSTMLRAILSMIGVIEILSPEQLIDAAERLALENPEGCELEPWVVPIARVEGLSFLFLAWRSRRSYSAFKKFLGVIGLLALLYPRAYVDYAADIAYADAAECHWRPWVYPVTRVVGLVYVLVGFNELRKS
jgi:hypothetical protein